MATLTITVDDAIVPRLRAAYGVDTNPQLKAVIIDSIKTTVREFEKAQVAAVEQAKIATANEAKDIAIAAAEQLAQSEIAIS